MRDEIIRWLLEEKNPEIKLRTQTELLNVDRTEREQTVKLVTASEDFAKMRLLLNEQKPWPVCNALTAFAEWGLTKEEVETDRYVDWIIENTGFKLHCGEGMLLRTLVKLGYGGDERIKREIQEIFGGLNQDGGFQCISTNRKINAPDRPHKSCYRLPATYLLLLAELKLHLLQPAFEQVFLKYEQTFMEYFLKRNILFRTDDPSRLVVEEYDKTYFPTDCIAHGVQEILYACSVLGYGNTAACESAWELAGRHRTQEGKYLLAARPSKPYFKVGTKGRENKWVTLYMLLAEKYRDCSDF
ncbi:MAG: hypothetical protein K2N94_16580 [Lachnospiraceae bacterium]|nr:hypothetical protein [Lachnospiraceae bacterium]